MGVINDELEEIQKLCEHIIPDCKLISCVESLVRVEIRKTKVKSLTVCLQFPPDYPNYPLLVELKSKHLSNLLLNKLTQSCDEEVKKFIGKPQVIQLLKFVENFMNGHPLVCCYDEINDLKNYLADQGEIKLNQKTSQVSLKVTQDKYFVHCKLFVPQNYPDQSVEVELETNFPPVLQRFLVGQSKEISRQCSEPPLNAKKRHSFVSRLSLQCVGQFIISCSRDFVTHVCPVCSSACLPSDPQEVVLDESAGSHIERVYCGHLYHLKCLLDYLKTPPFKGGKKCPLCNEKIQHEKWKVADKLAEDRWAHKQARDRELLEVVDFLS